MIKLLMIFSSELLFTNVPQIVRFVPMMKQQELLEEFVLNVILDLRFQATYVLLTVEMERSLELKLVTMG